MTVSTTTHIDLDRQFVPWIADRDQDPEVLPYLDALGSRFTWRTLLERRRVVVLAEAGSGKSAELERQTEILTEEGRVVFGTTLKRVGQRGFQSALGKAEWQRLQDWRSRDGDAWLFLDSVDEARKADFSFAQVMREVGEEIVGVAGRMHLVISGRFTDWQFKRDLASLLRLVPIPPPDHVPNAVTPDDALKQALRPQKAKEAPKTEEPLVVVMTPLSRDQVKRFCHARGVDGVEKFLAELAKQNLWPFARRPTDLDWLVSYWRSRQCLGSLAEMLELSITERLKETNPALLPHDDLDMARAVSALYRVGASLVLQRVDRVAVPDTSLDLADRQAALSVENVLPDWSAADRTRLITRPIFDPASAGLARLHNDNEGAVRGYLAAKWFDGLHRKENCPWSQVARLLFAETHGVKLVKPSMRSTAAWMALTNQAVAREVIERDPRLLMDAGDPGSLSLDTRIAVLRAMLVQIKADEDFDIPDRDSLRRFAKADLAPFIRVEWNAGSKTPGVSSLLLLMIWLGEIQECADIASSAALGGHKDRYTPIFAGRALSTIGGDAEKRRYIQHLVANTATVSAVMVWDALEALFPEYVDTTTLLHLIDGVRSESEHGGLGLDYYGPRIVRKSKDAPAVVGVIGALMDRLLPQVDADGEANERLETRFLGTLEASGARLLELTENANDLQLAIDVALRVGEADRYRSSVRGRGNSPELGVLLRETPSRRRAALWRGVEVLRAREERAITDSLQVRVLGFDPGLSKADLPWLLEDIKAQTIEDNIRVATNATMRIWKQSDDSQILSTIKEVARSGPAAEVVAEWLTPRQMSEMEERFEREHKMHLERGAIEEAKRDQSWIEFRNELQRDPEQLCNLLPLEDDRVDGRLHSLWQLLTSLGDNHSHHAIRDLAPLVPLFGEKVVDALRRAFTSSWRRVNCKLVSERPPEERNTVYHRDLIGLVGVTQEAAGDRDWATKLDVSEAGLATRLATMELVGLPRWLDDVAGVHPSAVGDVLWLYAQSELSGKAGEAAKRAVSTLSEASDAVVATVAERMLGFLESGASAGVQTRVLDAALSLVARSEATRVRVLALTLSGLRASRDHGVRASYFAAAFLQDPEPATETLLGVLSGLLETEQVLLTQAALPRVFGTRVARSSERPTAVPMASLERLVVLAFSKIRPTEDNDRRSGVAYSPDERDGAEEARSALFNMMVNTPGYATFAALRRLQERTDFPIGRQRLSELARVRAVLDSETEPWLPQHVHHFERDFDSVPGTSAALQQVGLGRLDDIRHHLLHGDFNQGVTVAGLVDETAVQNWFADALSQRQKRSYSLEREPHVAGERKPDVRLQSRIADARCPIEIKVAESWTLAQLEEALTVQLRDRYLRDRNNRCGILLLVHKAGRPRGWQRGTEWLSFAQVTEHMHAVAREMCARDALAPQMEVFAIDVSNATPSGRQGDLRHPESSGTH